MEAKHKKKEDRKTGKGRGRGKGKGGGRGNKNKANSTEKDEPTKVRRSGKRNILSAGNESAADKKPTKKAKAAKDSGKDEAPGKPKAVRKTIAKPKAKEASKTKEKPQPKARSRATPKATAKAKGKAKAAPKAKGRRDMGPRLMNSTMRNDGIVKSLMDFARQFGAELEHDPKKLKEAVQKAMQPLEWTKLMPYWSRFDCGLKVWDVDTETFKGRDTFSFNSSSAPNRYKLAIAVRCAEIAVTFL